MKCMHNIRLFFRLETKYGNAFHPNCTFFNSISRQIYIRNSNLIDNCFIFYRFSVNFTLDSCSNSRNIAYHFKTDLVKNEVIHNYKTVDYWNDEIVEENTWIQGPGKVFAFMPPPFVHGFSIHIYRLHFHTLIFTYT